MVNNNNKRTISTLRNNLGRAAREIQNMYVTFCDDALGMSTRDQERMIAMLDKIDVMLSDVDELMVKCK